MIARISVAFALKKNKILSNGTAPVYLRITVQGKRIEITTRRYLIPSFWSNEGQRMKGSSAEARKFNHYLKELEQQVYEAYRLVTEQYGAATADLLRDFLTGKDKEKKCMQLVPVFSEHNRRIQLLVGKEYAPGTLERYETTLKHTVDFLQWHYKQEDFEVKKIDHQFITSFDFYLRSERNCSNNTTVKYLKNFKKIIRICLASGWLDKDPFLHYKSKVKAVDREYLTLGEIETISFKSFANKRIDQVRDIFIFCCYTGLAYADVKKLKRSEIVRGVDGQLWIFTKRKKTDTASRVPLLPVAVAILAKYQDHPECLRQDYALPVLSNQKMNSYLKEIADCCDLAKELTFHIARHSFATSVTLANGVSIESVSKMLGHTNLRTTQHYAKILDAKVSEDMNKLKGIFLKRSSQ